MDVLSWRLRRARTRIGTLVPSIDWLAEPAQASTWASLADRVEATRMPPWVHIGTGALATRVRAVGTALLAHREPDLEGLYREAGDVWSAMERRYVDVEAWEHELVRQPADAALVAALEGPEPAHVRPPGDLLEDLLVAVGPQLGRSTAAPRDSTAKLAAKLLRASESQRHPVDRNRLDLAIEALVPLRANPVDEHRILAERVARLFERGLPAGFAHATLPSDLSAGELIWPVVRETQIPGFRGLPFSSKAGRRCWKSADPAERARILVGIAQLATGRVDAGVGDRTALLLGLANLAERTAPAHQPVTFDDAQLVLLDALGDLPDWLRMPVDTAMLRSQDRLLVHEEEEEEAPQRPATPMRPVPPDLRGGELLWPLVEAVLADPSWAAWRSEHPAAVALTKAKRAHAGPVSVGMQQLMRRPGRFGIPANRADDVHPSCGAWRRSVDAG
ncbi:MAG: hypothetical protein H6734_02865 [Alphaproteobacteria bacterium]|nr:hypothetical protein [Alphaproteobacteria bacterium]